MRPVRVRLLCGAAGLVLAAAAIGAHAGVLSYCDRHEPLTALQQDRLLRFAAVVKAELDRSAHGTALIARSGIDLRRFGLRYSHAGVVLKASANAPWSVRQLYYACDEQRPKIFDQGMSGFVSGTDDPALGYLSIVFVPPAQADALERAALDNRQSLQLLGATYSANAYPFAPRYQNCNQWVVELLATAWGGLAGEDQLRARAQRWLQDNDYAPIVFEIGHRALKWAAAFVPWLHDDDHPSRDLELLQYRVSMPASIESFVQAFAPSASRIEFCHTDRHVVIKRGWQMIAEGCRPDEYDTVIELD